MHRGIFVNLVRMNLCPLHDHCSHVGTRHLRGRAGDAVLAVGGDGVVVVQRRVDIAIAEGDGGVAVRVFGGNTAVLNQVCRGDVAVVGQERGR